MKQWMTDGNKTIHPNNQRGALKGPAAAAKPQTGEPGASCCEPATPCCEPDNSGCEDTGCGDSGSCHPSSAKKEKWIIGWIQTPAGPVAQVSTGIDRSDRLGAIKTRLGINRMNYKVDPGIYAIGHPDEHAPVLVTANYKLTFDIVRNALSGMDAWLLILDTKGVNVWCAAGKGTFGTRELVLRMEKTSLRLLVSHKSIILPQLGATGVSAHEVAKKTGFRVLYGPVRIGDIQEFITNGNKASKEMRRVRFSFIDRLVLTPIEIIHALKTSIFIFGILFLANLFLKNPFGWTDAYAYFGALFTGCFLVPALLPWIPGRAFSWKGFLLGIFWACALEALHGGLVPDYGIIRAIGYFLILPSISGYYAMNFTGSSTYTSLSGVKKEMGVAIPILLAFFGAGAILLLLNGLGIL